MQTEPKPGTLYIVATPIGNLEDMTFRAVRILQAVDMIAAEDTRHTGRLLQHFQVKTPQISYHEHNSHSRIPELLEHLQYGKAIALVSDAGMPGISDPGYELIKACIDNGITVVPIPGASAVITALSAAGLPTDRFIFDGFLPAKSQQRQKYLESLQGESRTLVFYESPHRLRDTLADLGTVLGSDRSLVIARELTKLYEEFWRGTIEDAIADYTQREPQGEYTLLVAGNPPSQIQLTETELKAELLQLMHQGISRSQASRQLAKDTSLSRRYLYQLALAIEINLESEIITQPE
ncbi:MAG: 16S rRNA (cytidine(1402)-2'-O)-methyltransferase [Nostocales cyanobacterium LE14-WE4]|jgi:16S rRNA (cytidine1402-2'-O)-methyltransferase|uniref:16S rRNA (cytidine(1402)-2'-O)-methyltransferase n=1 Tax=Anabaena sp. AL09 TaxID=1710891 RepID=UPI0007FBAF8A|nr:16S rRNA (cytidine(1402)-2'-O)-methyltransferase [Anabaena sp. AL09]MCE2699218.1 16S rRNA (cytidine(1402)-2'-O)-methyltransferase [Anabaena sp. 49633_E8]MDJ0501120.1 16S rRNA (cytidine(1402)-2'-O)-methyltransferase [Nostocales cyanobacterium LE14-WE4]OBQ07337.1 MAG: 16S rRNA methyltransferase [Anabaena sp. LE011-02]MCE2703062.1 16S rRNA (cytidine(1402)-2'-O)-methyltransferase [Anabaena sp. 49633_E8]OBQ08988.1 MAG: 16S rRNA methyltransferase [Anabaena sp. AL09]